MKNIIIIILLIAPVACSNITLMTNNPGKKRISDICSAKIELNSDYIVSDITEENPDYSYCYIKNDSDSLLVWCDGYIQAEMYLVDLDLDNLTKPSDADLKTRQVKELKEGRRIKFKSLGNAFIIIDYGPKNERINDGGTLEILYYDTKLKQKLVFTTVNKELKVGFDVIPNKFRKDIVKALESIRFDT